MSRVPAPAAPFGEADLVEAVRADLAREPGPLTPHRVATALRAAGRPVGDTTVLAVHEALRRDVLLPLVGSLGTDGQDSAALAGALDTLALTYGSAAQLAPIKK